MIYSGPNTGVFSIGLGVLVGTALGATALAVPVSEVGKHFDDKKNTCYRISYCSCICWIFFSPTIY